MVKTVVIQVVPLQPQRTMVEQISTRSLWKTLHRAGRYYLNEAAVHREPSLEDRKGVRKKEQHRGTIMDRHQLSFPIPLYCLWSLRWRGLGGERTWM